MPCNLVEMPQLSGYLIETTGSCVRDKNARANGDKLEKAGIARISWPF